VRVRPGCASYCSNGPGPNHRYLARAERLGWQVANRLGQQLHAGRVANVEPVTLIDETAAWAIFSRYSDKCFSFTDCTSFALVQRLGIALCLVIDADFRAYGLHYIPDAH